jgi:hypothetical protein
LVKEINALKENEVLLSNKTVVAANTGKGEYFDPEKSDPKFKFKESKANPLIVNFIWDIFSKNAEAIAADFDLVTKVKNLPRLVNQINILVKEKYLLKKELL